MALAQKELAKRHSALVPGPQDVQRAELSLQAMGHPGWDMFHVHVQEMIAEDEARLSKLKDTWAMAYTDATNDAALHQQVAGMIGRISALKEVLAYLPGLVRAAQKD
jgi:hypothetical protein